MTLSFPDAGLVLDFKWKPVDPSWKLVTQRYDGINNSPRKELAAWVIQRLFLDPEDYVVPFTTAYCVPLADYHAQEPARRNPPSMAASACWGWARCG